VQDRGNKVRIQYRPDLGQNNNRFSHERARG
jgi:hypothetical protein